MTHVPGYELTLCKTASKLIATKTISPTETTPYGQETFWHLKRAHYGGHEEFVEALKGLALQPKMCIVRGNVLVEKKEKQLRNSETIDSVPRAWIPLDCDDVEVPEGLGAGDRVRDAGLYIRDNLLPPEFRGVRMIAAASPSTGLKGAGVARLRLFALLGSVISDMDLRLYTKGVKKKYLPKLDPAVCGTSQPIYTARPRFVGGAVDCVPEDQYAVILEGDRDRVVLDLSLIEEGSNADRVYKETVSGYGIDWRRCLTDLLGRPDYNEVLKSALGIAANTDESDDEIVGFTWSVVRERAVGDRGRLKQYGEKEIRRKLRDFRKGNAATEAKNAAIDAHALETERHLIEEFEGVGFDEFIDEVEMADDPSVNRDSGGGSPPDFSGFKAQVDGGAPPSGGRGGGRAWPDCDKKGNPVASLQNAMLALQRLGLTFYTDTFKYTDNIEGERLNGEEGRIKDSHIPMLRLMVRNEYGFDPGKNHTIDALTELCRANKRHPVRDYLDGLKWDGVKRLDSWLVKYMGAEDNALNRAIGRLVLIAAVRRVRRPGCKFDHVMVLEGDQGIGKSTAVKILAGDEYYSDATILSLHDQKQMEALEGVWLYEIGELRGLKKAEVEHVKSFVSRQVDRGRMAYGHYVEERPRQAIFIGTTNDDQYLSDPSGNRRWWPVKTGKVDWVSLAADRDQLWAEAADAERGGASLELDKGLWGAASETQEARVHADPWEDVLEEITTPKCTMAVHYCGEGKKREMRVKAMDVMECVLRINSDRRSDRDSKRLAAAMRRLGWTGPKVFELDGKSARGYVRPWPEDQGEDNAGSETSVEGEMPF